LAPAKSARFDYIAVGHVTRDLIEDRSLRAVSQPGGGAFYSALQASRLGLRTLIVTQGVPEEIETLLVPYRDELDLHIIAARHTTTLSTRGSGASRSQRLLSWAGPIVQPLELHGSILHIAPTAGEGRISWGGGVRFVGITPQGLIRGWQERGEVPLMQLDAASLLGDIPLVPPDAGRLAGEISLVPLAAETLPARFDAAVIGEQECDCCHALFAAARETGACVAVTAGSRPTTVHLSSRGAGHSLVQAPIVPVAVREDLGAGDVFAAAFFMALADGRTALDAATFGNAAAAVRIAGSGPDAIGNRAQIEAALAQIDPTSHETD
jgi:hypothetical protein